MTWRTLRPMLTSTLTRGFRLGLAGALLVSLASAPPAQADPGTDPRIEPIPALDFGQGAKSIVVRLNFTGRYNVTLTSAKVSLGRAHAHVGNPPLLRVELFNDKDVLVKQYNEWHPLWANLYDAGGTHSRVTLASASGRFVVPFAPDLKTVKVIDIADPNAPELIAVDVRPAIKAYCQANPQDTDCPLGPAALWVGLKNSDDQGTKFDVQVRIYTSLTDPVDQPLATGLTRCVAGVTRNPGLAKEIPVEFTQHVAGSYAIRVFTRIGTNADDTKCLGPGGSHHNALGLRLYFDTSSRPSRIGNPSLYLHDATPSDRLNTLAPGTGTTKQEDSSIINFSKGNPWREVGTGWTQ